MNGESSAKHSIEDQILPSEQQSDWDALRQVGNDELLGKFGRHTKEYLNSEFREKERQEEKRVDKMFDDYFKSAPKASAEYQESFYNLLQQNLRNKKKDIRHEYMEWLLANEQKPDKTKKQEETQNVKADKIHDENPRHPHDEDQDKAYDPHDEDRDKTYDADLEKARELEHQRAIENDLKEKQASDQTEAQASDIAQVQSGDQAKAQHPEDTTGEPSPEAEAKDRIQAEIDATKKRIADYKAEIEEIQDLKRSLVMVKADFTHDKKELARDYAERELNSDLAKSNFLKRIWKGDLLKKYYWKKYEKDIYEGRRKVHLNGESSELDQIIEKRSHDAIARFVEGVLDDPETSRFVHRNIGKNGENGEKLDKANQEFTDRIKLDIKRILRAGLEKNLSEEDFTHEINEKFKQKIAEARDKKEPKDDIAIYSNYAEVISNAYRLVKHHQDIDKVMEFFQLYNADVRNNQRTEAHRNATDFIIEKLEKSSIGAIVPTEIIVNAATTISTVNKYVLPFAATAILGTGLGFTSTLSALREGSRANDDRTRMMRGIAEGASLSEQLGLRVKNMSDKKKEAYEAKIAGILYTPKTATELIKNIDEAKDKDALLRAVAEARVRIDYSDFAQKDLIAYSSADAMGKERIDLDAKVIQAEKSLSENKVTLSRLNAIKKVINSDISQENETADRNFRTYRRIRALKRFGKTFAIGAISTLTLQELFAAASPNKIGLFEKLAQNRGIEQGNNSDASETILAHLVPNAPQAQPVPDIPLGSEAPFEEAGFDTTQVTEPYLEVRPPVTREIDPSEVTGIRASLRWANNSTQFADGNELGLHIDQANGSFFTRVSGNSTLQSGEVIDVAGNVANGNARLLVNTAGKTFEIVPNYINPETGQAVFGQNGYVYATDGTLLHILGDNGERLFETVQLAIKEGVGEDFSQLFTAIATANGNGVVGTFFKTVQDAVAYPATVTAVPPAF